MMGSREGFLERRRRRRASERELARKADLVRSDARAKSKRRSSERRRARFSGWRDEIVELWMWIKGSAFEIRRRAGRGGAAVERRVAPVAAVVSRRVSPALAPASRALVLAWGALSALLRPLAPQVAAALFALVRALGAVLSGVLVVGSRVRATIVAVARALIRWMDAHVTAARVCAALAIAAAAAIAASQFVDYRGIAIGADQYQGDAGEVAPVPQLNRELTGDAHAYLMLPLALLAIILASLALRGRPRLALLVSLIGLAGIVVTLAVDLPQALDTGRIGEAYEGTEARLLTGFWIQLIGSAVLLAAGLALARFAGGARRRAGRTRPATRSTSPRGGAEGHPGGARAPGAHGGHGAAGSGAGA
jgi:hypothetical protein